MSRLTVSVTIATYNRMDLLPRALDSLLNQTHIPTEIIVVDDGSTDETPQVLERYGPPVVVIRQRANRGLPVARNIGLRAATCDLIAFLDSDDILPQTSIEHRVSFLESRPEVLAVYGGALMIDMEGHSLGWFRPPPFPRGMIFHELACRTVFPMHAVMFHRQCLDTVGYFDEDLRLQLDFDFWARFGAVYPFEAIDEVLAYYYVHHNMSSLAQARDLTLKGIEVRERIFRMPAFQVLSAQQQARTYSVQGTDHILSGKMQQARHWYFKAIRTSPSSARPYGLMALSLLGPRAFEFVASTRHRLLHKIDVTHSQIERLPNVTR